MARFAVAVPVAGLAVAISAVVVPVVAAVAVVIIEGVAGMDAVAAVALDEQDAGPADGERLRAAERLAGGVPQCHAVADADPAQLARGEREVHGRQDGGHRDVPLVPIIAEGGELNAENVMLTGNNVATQAQSGGTLRISNTGIFNNLDSIGCGGGTVASAGNNRNAGNFGGAAPCAPNALVVIE